jgi:hypothetical protein
LTRDDFLYKVTVLSFLGRTLWREAGSVICQGQDQGHGHGHRYITTNNQSVCLGVWPNRGLLTRICSLLEISVRQLQVCNFVAPSLTRGRVCKLLYNCFWALPGQPLLGRSPAELTALFCCLIWDSVQFRLVLARAVTLRSKSRRTHGLILLSHLRLHQPGGPGPCISKSR